MTLTLTNSSPEPGVGMGNSSITRSPCGFLIHAAWWLMLVSIIYVTGGLFDLFFGGWWLVVGACWLLVMGFSFG